MILSLHSFFGMHRPSLLKEDRVQVRVSDFFDQNRSVRASLNKHGYIIVFGQSSKIIYWLKESGQKVICETDYDKLIELGNKIGAKNIKMLILDSQVLPQKCNSSSKEECNCIIVRISKAFSGVPLWSRGCDGEKFRKTGKCWYKIGCLSEGLSKQGFMKRVGLTPE